MARGGKREGAGAKKKEATKRMSVPLSLVYDVEGLIQEQKELMLNPYPEALDKLIEKLPEYQNDMQSLAHMALMFESWDSLESLPRNHKRIILKLLK